MKLNEAKGNMYDFITHTANAIKGECYHGCTYCYMKRWGKQKPVHLDEKELKTPMSEGNFIFVGSSCDMFASNIRDGWIEKVLHHCCCFENTYLFQTKNPAKFPFFLYPESTNFCITLETNRFYKEYMVNSPTPMDRAYSFYMLNSLFNKYITIEPIMDFDLKEFIDIIKEISPEQINIGADSCGHKLPEPPKEKLLELISELKKFTVINKKSNLGRLLK